MTPVSVVAAASKDVARFDERRASSPSLLFKFSKLKKKLLFVCIENSNRSQMAEAFAKMLGVDKVQSFSAGSKPSGKINPKAIASMKKLGYDLSSHACKSLDDVKT